MSSSSPAYTGFRKSRGWGVGKLGTRGTIAVFVSIFAICMSPMLGSLSFTLVLVAVAVPTLFLTVIPFGERTAMGHIAHHGRWASAGNATAWADDVFEEVARGENLPGVLATLCPIKVEDGRGDYQCLIWNRRTGILSARLHVSPVGLTLADDDDALQWVTNFGGLLADLGHMPLVSAIAFTAESAPSGGVNQRAYTVGTAANNWEDGRLVKDSPQVCREILTELVSQSRATTAEVTCLVTINFDLKNAVPEPKTLAEGAAEVVNMLPRFESSLAASGMTVTHRASTGQTIRYLRAAFDPAVRTADFSQDDELWEWADAGPLRTEESADVYSHDSGYSVSWLMKAPPRGVVRYRQLIPLVSPGRYHRRVSLVYRPYSAGEASKKVEDEVNAGTFRRIWANKTKKDETQRDHDDRVKARRAAQEESLGAGLGRFTMYVTTTVRNEQTLAAACSDVEERMGQAKIHFRRARKAMAATFAASLGVGIEPSAGLSRISTERWGS